MNIKWTKKMEAYIIVKRNDLVPYKQLVKMFNSKFKTNVKVVCLQQRAFKLGITKNRKIGAARKPNGAQQKRQFRPNQKQINFIHAMVGNNYPDTKIMMAYEEQFGESLTIPNLVNTLTKPNTLDNIGKKALLKAKQAKPLSRSAKQGSLTWNKARVKFMLSIYDSSNEVIISKFKKEFGYILSEKQINNFLNSKKADSITKQIAEENRRESKVKPFKLVKETTPNWHTDSATRKQCRCIIGVTTNLTGPAKTKATNELFNSNEYTKLQARDFIKANEEILFNWKKEQGIKIPSAFTTEEIISEVIGETSPKSAKTMWSSEEDLDLLCNFYEYSIDEARNHFNLPFQSIAGRLETLIDSTEPHHIELLMEATNVIKTRKAQALEEATNGFWKRRKLRKQAKRETKKALRLESKLNRLENMFSKRQANLDKEINRAELKLKKLRGEE